MYIYSYNKNNPYFYLPILLYDGILMQKDFAISFNFPTFATASQLKYIGRVIMYNCVKYLCKPIVWNG
ncbi:hypothetical protein DXB63_10070 [Bacteroides sp. OM05-12]|nr:hypothetical protein DXB63_10070 [Bacteroides sp. OM05-12]